MTLADMVASHDDQEVDVLHAELCARATRRDRGPITRTTHYALYAQAYNRMGRK